METALRSYQPGAGSQPCLKLHPAEQPANEIIYSVQQASTAAQLRGRGQLKAQCCSSPKFKPFLQLSWNIAAPVCALSAQKAKPLLQGAVRAPPRQLPLSLIFKHACTHACTKTTVWENHSRQTTKNSVYRSADRNLHETQKRVHLDQGAKDSTPVKTHPSPDTYITNATQEKSEVILEEGGESRHLSKRKRSCHVVAK